MRLKSGERIKMRAHGLAVRTGAAAAAKYGRQQQHSTQNPLQVTTPLCYTV